MRKNKLHAAATSEVDSKGITYWVSLPAHDPSQCPDIAIPGAESKSQTLSEAGEGEVCRHKHKTSQAAFACSRNRFEQ